MCFIPSPPCWKLFKWGTQSTGPLNDFTHPRLCLSHWASSWFFLPTHTTHPAASIPVIHPPLLKAKRVPCSSRGHFYFLQKVWGNRCTVWSNLAVGNCPFPSSASLGLTRVALPIPLSASSNYPLSKEIASCLSSHGVLVSIKAYLIRLRRHPWVLVLTLTAGFPAMQWGLPGKEGTREGLE